LDRYGVPHIIAPDARSAFYGLAWAQMHAHGNLLLRLYGLARGRGAEYWGEEYLESDKWVRSMGVPERAARWYERQRPAYKACLEAFVGGLNAYAAQHADRLDPAVLSVLPIRGADVLGHVQHVILFNFLAQPPRGDRSVRSLGQRLERVGNRTRSFRLETSHSRRQSTPPLVGRHTLVRGPDHHAGSHHRQRVSAGIGASFGPSCSLRGEAASPRMAHESGDRGKSRAPGDARARPLTRSI
jgi:hypothetical protein